MPAWTKIAAASGALAIGTSLAGIPAVLFGVPLVRAPKPTGRWHVGTVTLALPASSEAHRLPVARFWYPAPAGARGRGAPYVDGSTKTLRTRFLNGLVATSAVASAPMSDGRFPVVIYVPGWGGGRESNTAQAENLASNGYVVVALDDLYPEGPMDFSSRIARDRTVMQASRKLDEETQEVARVISALAALDVAPKGRFSQRLDLRRIGVLGFSFGGAVAAELARRDARVAAAVDLDGWLFGEALGDGVPRPFMLVGTALDTPPSGYVSPVARRLAAEFDRENVRRTLAGMRRYGGLFVTVDGTDHGNFTDAAWLPSLRRNGLGPIDGRRGSSIILTAVLQFFDRALKGAPAPLFERSARLDRALHVRAFPVTGLAAAVR